jgi:hypothetical protein
MPSSKPNFKGFQDLLLDFLAGLGAELLALSWTPPVGATWKVVSTSVKAFLPSPSMLHFPLTYLVHSASAFLDLPADFL